MLWLIFTILLGLVGLGALIFATGVERIAIPILAGLVWLVLSFFLSLHTVGQRQVGIVYSFSGTVQGKKDPGVVMTWPWQHLKKEHVGTQRIDFIFDSSNSAVSKDQQDIYARVSVNLNVEPRDVLHLYKTVGSGWKHIILEPRVPQDFKEVTATYNTVEIPKNREQIRVTTRDRLRSEMTRLQFGIEIQDVFLTNLDYSAGYKRAVERKQEAVQRAQEAAFKADAVKAEADGEAYALRAKAAAIRSNPEVLQLKAIEKLSPNVQTIICTGRTCPAFLPSGLVTGSK